MANDLNLQFHGTQSAGTTFTGTDTTGTNGPTIDLGSNSVNRTLLLERRIGGTHSVLGGKGLDITFFDSSDNSTFVAMPGTTSSAALGFALATTNSYGSTDAIAPSGPGAVAKIVLRTDKRYIRARFQTGTSAAVVGGVTVIGKVLGGAYSGQGGPIDV